MECAIDPFDARYSYTTLYYGAITRYINNASGRKIAGEGTNGITEEGAGLPRLSSEPMMENHGGRIQNVWITETFAVAEPSPSGKSPITWAEVIHRTCRQLSNPRLMSTPCMH
jgi:hypothetical protein